MTAQQIAPVVLVVDDDPDILATIGQILDLEGYGVLRARNGQEAFVVLETERPALIILDLMMPVMDGWEFRRRLTDHPAGLTPVLIVSADRDLAGKAASLNAQGYIAKPFDLDVLVAAVQRFAPLT